MIETVITQILVDVYQAGALQLARVAHGEKDVFRVQRGFAPDWILRIYPVTEPAPSRDGVLALANLLVFLEQHQYPTERVVRTVDGSLTTQSEQWHMLVTTYLGPSLQAWQPASTDVIVSTSIDAARVMNDPQLLFQIGALLGQLHALDATEPAAEQMIGRGLQVAAELAWASSELARLQPRVPTHLQDEYAHLTRRIQQVRRFDTCPQTIIHGDCHLGNVVGTPAHGYSFVDWEAAGRGAAAMVTLGEIFRRYGPQYRAQFGHRMSPEQYQVMRAIEQCRTEALGGHVYSCPACATRRYSYHSCRNRHCPTCQQDAAQTWMAEQQARLLPVPYFLITFTLPAPLRAVARQHPRTLYTFLFRASAAALQQLAQDRRFLGGQIGMIGVLQTWTRDLRFHPHVHYLVPAIALAPDGALRQPGNPAFLVAAKPLAILFRAKLRAALRQTDLYQHIPADIWRQAWVVDCRAVGSGAAALKYLAPYIFRVALSNNRIVGVQDDRVTFRYRDGATKQMRTCTLGALAFIGRFLQHVLPHGLVKIRYYGLLRVGNRHVLEQVRVLLMPPKQTETSVVPVTPPAKMPTPPGVLRCPVCGQPMQLVQTVPRQSRAPPASQ